MTTRLRWASCWRGPVCRWRSDMCAIRVSLTRAGRGGHHDADQRLGRGAATLGDAEITRHVVIGEVRNELNCARRSMLVLAPGLPLLP